MFGMAGASNPLGSFAPEAPRPGAHNLEKTAPSLTVRHPDSFIRPSALRYVL